MKTTPDKSDRRFDYFLGCGGILGSRDEYWNGKTWALCVGWVSTPGTWFRTPDFCSKPGCGFPDGKPCIGCGRIVHPPILFCDNLKELP